MEHVTVIQAEFRVLLYNLSLHLELDDRYSFMHPDIQFRLTGTAGICPFKLETGTGVISVGIQGKGCQRQQVDAVSVLQDIQVAVSGADADCIGNAPLLARGSPHPQHVVVSPLDIQGMVGHQLVHNHVGPRPPVIYIPQNM